MMRLEKLSFVSSSLVLNSLVPELLLELELVLLFKKLAILEYYSLNIKYSPPIGTVSEHLWEALPKVKVRALLNRNTRLK